MDTATKSPGQEAPTGKISDWLQTVDLHTMQIVYMLCLHC